MMQERYGEGKEQAEPEAAEFLRVGTQANGGVSPPEAEPARVPAPSPPAHREESPPAAPASSVPLAPLPPHQDGHPPATRPETESPPAAGYAHSATVWISPRVLRWVAPLAVLALFVFLFLPWTGAYPGGYGVYTQNGFQTTWGGVSVDPVGAKALDSVQPYANVGANRLMLLYTLLVLLALVIILAPLALTPARAQVLPPVVRSLWRRRLELLSAVGLVALLVLLIQLRTDFGLEAAVAAGVDKHLAGELAAPGTPEEQKVARIHRGLQLGPYNLSRTLWPRLAVLGHVLLLAGLGLELWIRRRGARPLPRVDWRA
jgi:hypothetical protein